MQEMSKHSEFKITRVFLFPTVVQGTLREEFITFSIINCNLINKETKCISNTHSHEDGERE